MLHGIILLRGKPGFENLTLTTVALDRIEEMQRDIKAKLLPIRGAKDAWADTNDPDRFAAAAALAPAVYGVATMADLKLMATKLSVEINAAVRGVIGAASGMRAGDWENKLFFANRG